MRQRLIGLLGGISWESTAEYYRLINMAVQRRLGGLHAARCLVWSFDFAEIEALQRAGHWDEATRLMIEAARNLERAGADLLVICANTMHRMADEVQAAIDIPLLHIADATAARIKAAGLSRVGLLGTAYTMEQEFYKGRLAARHALEVMVPEAADRALVHRVIFDELVLGRVEPASRDAYRGVMHRLVARGADCIVLGCTEFMLLGATGGQHCATIRYYHDPRRGGGRDGLRRSLKRSRNTVTDAAVVGVNGPERRMNLGQKVIVIAKSRAIDPRLFQIATLASLLVLGIWRFELAAGLPQIAVTVSSSLLTQALFCRWQHKRFDPLSPLVTGLSLSLLLRTHDAVLWLAAPAIAISAKYIIRINHKHLFNPACIAIVTLLLTTHSVWVVPGQWGALAWGAAAVAMAASLVLVPTGRIDVAVAFLAGWALLLAARCLWLGDPWTIPVHQMQSGVLLIFACFMLTDPRSTPDSVGGRVLFALAVAVLGYWFQFGWQVREGLFYALAIVSVSTPLLDRLLPAGRFQWTIRPQEV